MSNSPRKVDGRGKIQLICPACKKDFQIFRCHYRGATNACSKECAELIKPRKQRHLIDCVCKTCGKPFQIRKGRGGTGEYCSIPCMAKVRGQNMRGENHPLWNGGTSTRSYSSRKTIAQVINERKKCEECGNVKCLQGHHIKSHASHLPGRADPTNIQVLCKWCHSKKHPRLSSFILAGESHS